MLGALAISVALLVAPASASANFELAATFGDTGVGPFHEGEIGEPGGLATNAQTGDLYEADRSYGRVLRFDREGHFLEAWGWGVGDGAEEFERCGPAGEIAHPTCEGRAGAGQGINGEGAGQLFFPASIAVDQTTGDVYVENGNGEHHLVEVFGPAGEILGSFGDKGSESEEQIQAGASSDSLAVTSGVVYLLDSGEAFGPRVMVFAPVVPGDLSTYAYSKALFGPLAGGYAKFALDLATDNAGDILLARENKIFKFAHNDLTVPAWELTVPEAEGVAADPTTGDVFYYTGKKNIYHELDSAGKPVLEFSGAAGQSSTPGAAFNPNVVIGGHPPGALYADTALNPVSKKPQRALIFVQQATHPPLIEAARVTSVGTTIATLGARISPNGGGDTHYSFRYGTAGPCASNPCSEAPVGGTDLGSGITPLDVSFELGGLEPDRTYHYEVVASNAFGATESSDVSFHTFATPSGLLPDQRQYELVSPIDKHGGEVIPIDPTVGSCAACEPGEDNAKMPMEATPDGNSVVFEGFPFFPAVGAVDENEYLARRTVDGWQTTPLSPQLESREGFGFVGFSPTLSEGILGQTEPTLSSEAPGGGFKDFYLRGLDGHLTPLLTHAPPHRTAHGEGTFDFKFAGASADFTHFILSANDALTGQTATAPAATDGGVHADNLYEWSEGQLRLVNVLPGNATSLPGAAFGSGTELGGGTESQGDFSHAISADGTRIFWSAVASGQVYVRERGEVTTEIPDAGKFLDASPDGARVLLSDGRIYDLQDKAITDLTAGAGGFEGFVGGSEDLSKVYFVDTAVLTGGEVNGDGATAQAGHDNLYLSSSGKPSFIGVLAVADNQSGSVHETGVWQASPSDRQAQVTPDGRYLAFTSQAQLTGFDNTGASGAKCGGEQACSEVFEYDAVAGKLICASCNGAAIAPVGASALSLISPIGQHLPPPHNLIDDGRLFFNSMDVLAPQDVRPGVENVYEFEHAGQGTCAAAEGCVALISSGHSEFDASFVNATPAHGSDVFFTTRGKLTPEDNDELVDLYDARENGGFVAKMPPAPCSGEGCKAPTPLPPVFPGVGSSGFSGPGNFASAPTPKPTSPQARKRKCPRGKILSHRRCIKRHKRSATGHRSRTRRRGR